MARVAHSPAWGALWVGALTACNAVTGLDDLVFEAGGVTGSAGAQSSASTSNATSSGASGGSTTSAGGSGGTGAQGGSGGTSSPGCPQGLPGPPLIDVGGFCMDQTEVTNAHYQIFLASAPSPTFGPECTFDTTQVPDRFPQSANLPVRSLDWCDAFAYCQWAGKRMCGKIGGTPGSDDDFNNAMLSEWHYACTNDGAGTLYAYGYVSDPNTCHGYEHWQLSGQYLIEVGSLAACHGIQPPFDQIYDLSGNVHELTAECDAYVGALDVCRVRGGGSPHQASENACAHTGAQLRNEKESDIGFRCCADKE
jgi:formylglycine-generating enzyme required for sulfatase activity